MALSEAKQFYVSADADLRRCRVSLQQRLPITITGTTEDYSVETFTGVVQRVEYFRRNPASLSWRITMRNDAQP